MEMQWPQASRRSLGNAGRTLLELSEEFASIEVHIRTRAHHMQAEGGSTTRVAIPFLSLHGYFPLAVTYMSRATRKEQKVL